ncbi:MAG: hypothetical protein GXZ09_01115 [Syntrophomonadaceae bacterium]|jgi:hypothetical protein|nr:hypothetical protein [Syntrophomonadaceae bacterium]
MHKRLSVVLFLSVLIIGLLGIGMYSAAIAPGGPSITPKLPADSNILKPNINAPTELTAANSDQGVSLTWLDNSNNEAAFELERKLDDTKSSFTILATVGAGVTSYVDTDVTYGTRYVYRVRAVSDTAVSPYSNEAAITAASLSIVNPGLQLIPNTPQLSLLPAAPANLAAIPLSTSEIKLNWLDQSSNEDGFILERKLREESDADFVQIAVIPKDTTEYIDSGLQEKTAYTYRICAYNSYGSSVYSNQASTQTIGTIYSQPAPTVIKYRIGQYSYSLNGVSYPMDVAPVILHSRTYLPIRYVAEPLGAAIQWDATQQKATVIFNGITVEMVIYSNMAWVNGVETPISNDFLVTAIVENGRILVPVAFVATSLGCDVAWDAASQDVILTYPKP